MKDGVATTGQIDDIITHSFGLRWAQKGLFETYRVAGGQAGMKHFLEQFGPCLEWPWTKLMDVPDLNEELIDRIVEQSDEQAAGRTVMQLENERDRNSWPLKSFTRRRRRRRCLPQRGQPTSPGRGMSQTSGNQITNLLSCLKAEVTRERWTREGTKRLAESRGR